MTANRKISTAEFKNNDFGNCELHPTKRVESFCVEDKKLLCSQCLIDSDTHQTHLRMSPESAVADVRAELAKQTLVASKLQGSIADYELTKAATSSTKITDAKHKTMDAIKQFFNSLVDALDAVQTEAIQQVMFLSAQELLKCDQNKTNANFLKKEATHLLRAFRDMLTKPDRKVLDLSTTLLPRATDFHMRAASIEFKSTEPVAAIFSSAIKDQLLALLPKLMTIKAGKEGVI